MHHWLHLFGLRPILSQISHWLQLVTLTEWGGVDRRFFVSWKPGVVQFFFFSLIRQIYFFKDKLLKISLFFILKCFAIYSIQRTWEFRITFWPCIWFVRFFNILFSLFVPFCLSSNILSNICVVKGCRFTTWVKSSIYILFFSFFLVFCFKYGKVLDFAKIMKKINITF